MQNRPCTGLKRGSCWTVFQIGPSQRMSGYPPSPPQLSISVLPWMAKMPTSLVAQFCFCFHEPARCSGILEFFMTPKCLGGIVEGPFRCMELAGKDCTLGIPCWKLPWARGIWLVQGAMLQKRVVQNGQVFTTMPCPK